MKSYPNVEKALKDLKASKEEDRKIKYVILHHTYEPNHSDWREVGGADAIKTYWLQETAKKGWEHPLGAHFIVSPHGTVFCPFTLRQVVNANSDMEMNRHGVAIETVGNFDIGHDKLYGVQLHTINGLVGGLLEIYGLDSQALRFHRRYNREKTCPGSGLDLETVRRGVEAGQKWAKNFLK